MNRILVPMATVLSVVAVVLAMQHQAFIRVDAGGPKLRMLVVGSGSPTVVFDTGGEGSLELWGTVPSEVSKFAKTIAYDRAGNGLSDKAATPRDGRNIAAELHAALRNANASPPYVLVGHSIGGPYIRVFAGMYPDEVTGMVLVDPTQEETDAWVRENGLDRRVEEECSSDSERGCASAILAQAHESTVPASIPVVLVHAVVTRARPFRSKEIDEMYAIQAIREPVRLKFHKEWVEKIPGGQLITVNTSHGLVNFEAPDLMVRIIRETVEKARDHSRQ
jgi:pimeloyl-ACP methyl ester carboxylesterase